MSLLGGIWPWKAQEEGQRPAPSSSASVASHSTTGQRSNASTAANNNKRPPLSVPPVLAEDDTSLVEVENEDELAKRMLVQFPAYGSHSQAYGGNQLNPTADWLLGGTSDIPNPQQQRLIKQREEELRKQEEQNEAYRLEVEEATRLLERRSRNSLDERALRDWNKDEQLLWKTHTEDTVEKQRIRSLGSKNLEGFSERAGGMKRQEGDMGNGNDFLENWLEATYYHVGVKPAAFLGDSRSRTHHPLETTVSPAIAVADRRDKNTVSKARAQEQLDQAQDRANDGSSASAGLIQMNFGVEAPSETSGGSKETIPEDDRQHWMPDQFCKQCYHCDATFTVFRRRHHCRICGQVFCNSCSGYFIPADKQSGSAKQGSPTNASTQIIPFTSTTALTGVSNKTILRSCKMCFDQVNERKQKGEEGAEGDAEKRRKRKEEPLAAERQKVVGINNGVLPTAAHPTTRPAPVDTGPPPLNDGSQPQQDLPIASQEVVLVGDEPDALSAREVDVRRSKQLTTTPRGYTPLSPAALKTKLANRGGEASQANRHIGLTAAAHLEKLGSSLLDSDAPQLWNEVRAQAKREGTGAAGEARLRKKWINKIMSIATRCCAGVDPNVRNGDLLDIRPYCKVKVIPGGSLKDCVYVSGVVFRKTLNDKRMTSEVINPRIMLLSGGIEFTRSENQIASFDTLLEQEEKYMEILVGRILKLDPDVLMVGKSVSRRAQDLLLKAKVVLLQHVKSTVLNRVSRQTGATIISSTDHIMNQFGEDVMGKCHRFRFVVARDNEAWTDEAITDYSEPGTLRPRRNVRELLGRSDLPTHERQAALAAERLGQSIIEGSDAVKGGLADRRVANSYVMIEGCPRQLGCTVVLRGASRSALKQLKVVLRFLLNVAYNLKLETSFFKERCARIRSDFEIQPENLFSSSLCVDFGKPPGTRKVRPWNGGSNNENPQRSISGKVSAYDHQSILITSVWMTEKTQCCPAEVKGICYYSLQDVSVGQFLRDSCFNLSLKCQNPSCKKSVLDHSLSFVHNDGLMNITVEHMEDPLPPAPSDIRNVRSSDAGNSDSDEEDDGSDDSPIATWTYCKTCKKIVTPLVYISENTWKYSFGKFLESYFYNRSTIMNSPDYGCSCDLQNNAILYFGCGSLAARFTYERVSPFGVFVRKGLPIDLAFHRNEALRQLDEISIASSKLFVKFDKHIEKVSREARYYCNKLRNRPENLQTVFSELTRIGSEVDHASKTLQEKIASVSDKCTKQDDRTVQEALFRFPWFARRYLFMLCSAWNEKLSAAGQAIMAMRKLASSSHSRHDMVMPPNVPSIGADLNEELYEGIKRLRQLHEVYSRYNLTDITTVLPILPGSGGQTSTPVDYDDDFEDPGTSIDFEDSVDADVLASRKRLYSSSSPVPSNAPKPTKPKKSLGTRRDDSQLTKYRGTPDTIPNSSVSKVTPGGAVKSAINRLFNRGGRESDPYVVDLGMFNEGRPRLEPGVNGIVVPVNDDQLCTVIAYSMSSSDYADQFKEFSKPEPQSSENDEAKVDQLQASSPTQPSPSKESQMGSTDASEKQGIERRMLIRTKSHIKHTFRDFDEKGQSACKFVCTTYWATQFHAVREVFLSDMTGKDEGTPSKSGALDVEQAYVQSLSSAFSWAASGGKSGASFARTSDDRFVIKHISRTELQMFLDCAPAYFEYLSKAFFHGLPTVLCKILGVYQIVYHNRVTGKRSVEQVAVMQNIFYKRKISKTFDLKGSLRGRFTQQLSSVKDDSFGDIAGLGDSQSNLRRGSDSDMDSSKRGSEMDSFHDQVEDTGPLKRDKSTGTLLDGDFLEFTNGRPMPLNDRSKAVFHMSILNDTLFLSIINVLDYSILVGIDEENMELVVGIIDFMRQYDILKQMERVGKSLPMVVGSEAPTIIQPPLYKARFTNAMERYFMTVPNKWTLI